MQRFMLDSNVFFGRDCALGLPKTLQDRGLMHAGIVVDENLSTADRYGQLRDDLKAAGISIVREYPSRSTQEPTYEYLDVVADQFRHDAMDVVLGVGGGSTLDLAKGVAILRNNPGKGIEYRGMDKVQKPGVPVILIPSTAGTGSEATKTASFEDSDSKLKLGINGQYVGCLFAYLDPSFVVSCPLKPTISAALDVLVHAFEAVTCKTANAISTVLGREASRIMFESLPRVVTNLNDLQAREETLLGSHFAGLAMWNAGGGPASGISYPLGVYHHVPHGFAGGFLLPHVVAYNVESGYYEGYAGIYDSFRLNHDDAALTTEQKAQRLVTLMFELYESLGLPVKFNQFGVSRNDIAEVTRLTLEQRLPNLELNPVPFGEKETIDLLEKVID
jgi:alcohol dehydrogenase